MASKKRNAAIDIFPALNGFLSALSKGEELAFYSEHSKIKGTDPKSGIEYTDIKPRWESDLDSKRNRHLFVTITPSASQVKGFRMVHGGYIESFGISAEITITEDRKYPKTGHLWKTEFTVAVNPETRGVEAYFDREIIEGENRKGVQEGAISHREVEYLNPRSRQAFQLLVREIGNSLTRASLKGKVELSGERELFEGAVKSIRGNMGRIAYLQENRNIIPLSRGGRRRNNARRPRRPGR